jgi:hypothetical protein
MSTQAAGLLLEILLGGSKPRVDRSKREAAPAEKTVRLKDRPKRGKFLPARSAWVARSSIRYFDVGQSGENQSRPRTARQSNDVVSLTPLVPHMMQRMFECRACDRRKDVNLEREAAAERKRA